MDSKIKIRATLSLSDKTFDFCPLYSGGCLWIDDFVGAVVLDMEGLSSLPDIVPCYLNHDESALVGTMTPEIRVVDGVPQIFAHGHFEDTLSARSVLSAYKGDGVVWEGSISSNHFSRLFDMDRIPPKQSVTVNNRVFYGPLNIVRHWSLCEGSFVKKGGDVHNLAVIHAQAQTPKEKIMSEELRLFITDCGSDPDSLTPDQLAIYEKAYAQACVMRDASVSANCEDDVPPEPLDPDSTDPPSDPTPPASESDDSSVEANDSDPSSLSSSDVSDPDDPNEPSDQIVASHGRVKAHSKRRSNPVSSRYPTGKVSASAGAPNRMDVYAVAMLRNLGTFTDAQVKASGFSDDAMTEGLAKKFNGWTFRDISCEMLRHATGNIYRGTEDAFVDFFFHPAKVRAAAFSTQNPLAILSNVLNKAYYEGSQRVPSVVSKIAFRVPLNDLHDATITSYEVFGLPPDQAEDAPLKHATLVGEDYEVSIGRSGNILTLTRDMLLKNDVEGFVNATLKLGTKHQRKREKRGLQKLLSALTSPDVQHDPLICTSNGNKVTKALSLEGLDIAAAALQSMTTLGSDPDDPEFTEFPGKYLLLPPSLAATAQSLFQATNLVTNGSGTITLTNTYHRYEPLVTPYLGASAGGQGSDTGWFLLADPGEASILAETRLRGAEEPHIIPVDTKDGVIGASWATFFEYGFGLMDRRAAVYSDGTT